MKTWETICNIEKNNRLDLIFSRNMILRSSMMSSLLCSLRSSFRGAGSRRYRPSSPSSMVPRFLSSLFIVLSAVVFATLYEYIYVRLVASSCICALCFVFCVRVCLRTSRIPSAVIVYVLACQSDTLSVAGEGKIITAALVTSCIRGTSIKLRRQTA